MQVNQIISDIKNYLNGIAYNRCYVGITNNARRRLFEEHLVNEKSGVWIYRVAESENIAREIEEYFLNLGMNGDTGGGSEECQIIYAYLKTTTTKP